ncbi:CHAT domain-containing protein [Portibacter marinus]|uniref:CHAT domain-containing protein n=1 Tax=Portibacter marinus TaxID=2898660 RepID=UPI001F2E7536|nr:CHAT domain-containing protein [Portibacter marinus]
MKILLAFLLSFSLLSAQNDCDSLKQMRTIHKAGLHQMEDYASKIAYLDQSAQKFINCEHYAEGLIRNKDMFTLAMKHEAYDDAIHFMGKFDQKVNELESKLSTSESLNFHLISKSLWSEVFEEMGHFSKSLVFLEEAHQLLDDSVFATEILKQTAISIFLELGRKYSRSGLYHTAIDHYENAIQVARKRDDFIAAINVESLLRGFIVNLYLEIGDIHEAKKQAEIRLSIANDLIVLKENQQAHLFYGHLELGQIHLELNNYDSVRMHITDLKYLSSIFGIDDYEILVLESKLLMAEGELGKSREKLLKIINKWGGYQEFYEEKEKFRALQMVEALIECGLYQEASRLNEVIQINVNAQLKELKDLSQVEIDNLKGIYLESVQNQISIPGILSQSEKFEMANEGFQIVAQFLKDVNPLEDKLLFAGKAADLSNSMLNNINLEENGHFAEVFYSIESGKSVILLRSWKDQQLINISENESIFQLEEKTTNEIIQETRNQLLATSGMEEDSIEGIIFEKQRLLDSLKQIIAERHELYFEMKYNWNIPSYEDFQGILSEDETFVNYFESDSFLYVISTTRESSHTFKIKKKEYAEKLNQFVESISTLKNNIDQLAIELYQILLAPIEDQLRDRLIFSCSGLLHSLPFSALKIAEEKYLISRHAISYTPSATFKFLQHRQDNSNLIQEALFVAPKFESQPELGDFWASRVELGELLYNNQEIDQASKFIKGAILRGEQASKSSFLKSIDHKDIVHLATHAKSNTDFPDESFLAFSNDIEERLFLSELSQLSLSPRLMVLSACETHVGKNYRGEGVLSLANACFFAGSESVLATQWSVLDEPTSQIIASFYKYLKRGQTKDKALQSAQIEYLDTNVGEMLHPYVWSGFTVIGNPERLRFSNFTSRYAFIFLLAIMVLIYVFLKKKGIEW